MRLVAIFIVFLGFTGFLTAQDEDQNYRTFGATVLAGFNASQIDGDESAGFNKVGVFAGLRGDIFIAPKMEIGIEISFSQRGATEELKFGSLNFLNINLNYIQVPVLFTFKDWYQSDEDYYRVRAMTGISYGRLFGAKAAYSAFEGREELFRENDISFHIGAAYSFGPHFRVSALYNRGLTLIWNNAKDDRANEKSLLTRWLTFRGEYSF